MKGAMTVSILPGLSSTATRASIVALAVLLLAGAAAPARAEGFISPYIGYNFGGDAGCPTILNCEDKRINFGAGLGVLGGGFGFEEDIAYAQDFFGTAPGLDSSVLTVMSNLMIAPKIGPVRPYVLGGVGLIKTRVSLTPGSVFSTDNNNFGWDIGGGVMVFFGEHVGVRGDIRYIHAFQDLTLLGFTLSDTKLDFGRASGGIVLKF
jgi:opacity protein-like surface antigen